MRTPHPPTSPAAPTNRSEVILSPVGEAEFVCVPTSCWPLNTRHVRGPLWLSLSETPGGCGLLCCEQAAPRSSRGAGFVGDAAAVVLCICSMLSERPWRERWWDRQRLFTARVFWWPLRGSWPRRRGRPRRPTAPRLWVRGFRRGRAQRPCARGPAPGPRAPPCRGARVSQSEFVVWRRGALALRWAYAGEG